MLPSACPSGLPLNTDEPAVFTDKIFNRRQQKFFSFLQTAGKKRQKTDCWRKEDERCGNTREEAGW